MEGMTQPNPNPPLNDSAREWGKDVNRAIAELQSGQDTNSGNLDTVMYTAEVAIDVANATQENIEQVIIPSIEAPLAVPAPPTGLNLVSARTGWTETGNPIGEATIGWNAVTQDVNSNALRIVGYEVLTGTAGGVLIARNLNPNPSFETGGSTFTVATNLATNPSFETGSGTVVVRRNLSKYQAESGTTTGWGTRGTGVVSLSNVNTQAHSGTRSYQIVCDGTASAQGLNQLASAGMLVSSGGTQETISLWVKLPLGATVNYIVEEYTTAAAYVGAVGGVALVTGTGDWQRISKTVTKSQAANVVRHVIQTNVAQAITFWADDSLIEAGATLGEFFDGGTPASGDFTYAWSGTANASTSEQRGVGIAGIGHVVGQTLAYQTTDALGHGAKSARWMLTTSGAIGIRAVSDAATPEVGKTYTLLILARAVSRDQSVIPRIGTTLAAPVTLQQGVATEIRVTVTATGASASQTGLLLQSGSGHQPGDLIDIDDALLVEVPSLDQPYTGPFFDGSTPDGDYNYAWTGTANASTSTAQATALTAGTAANAVAYRSSQWSAQGGFCAAIMPTGTSDASNLFIPASSLGMLPNTSYTIMATARLGAAQTGTLNAMARRMVITAGLTDPVVAPVIPDNAPGVYELRATLTTGATLGASDGVTLWNGASSGGGIIYWDNLAVIPVPSESQDYLYDYFDGSTPDVPGRIYTWSSTPDASISSAFGTLAGSTIGTVVSDLDKPLSFVVENLTPGKTYDIQVRATSAYGVQGILSDILTIAMPPAPEVALEPSTPIVDTRLGVVTTYWDGLLGEAIPLPGFLYVFAEFTREGTEDWAQFGPQLRKAGSVTLTSEPVGSTVHVRLRSVDNLGNVSAPSAGQEVIVVGVTGPDIEANSVTANHIEAGSISVTHLEPSVGQTLDISANDAVVIIAGGLDATNSNLEEMQTVYSFTPTEAVISSPESNFTLALDSDSIEIREGGVPVSWWNAGQMHVPSFVGDTVILGNHQLEKFGTGTVMRAL